MNLKEINNRISQIPVDQMKVIKTFCRPPEKSNEILEVVLEGKKFYCERPRYHWSRLDQSLIAESFTTEGQRVFGPKQETGFFDQRGLWWTTKKLCSLYLIPHYLQKPLKFIRIMSQHMVDSQRVISWLKQVNQNKDNDHKLIENLELMRKIYHEFYLYEASVFFVYDELVYRFKKFLLKYLAKKQVNTYLVQFMQAEMTKEALKRRMNEKIVYERPDSRGVLYAAGTEPQVYYRRPKYFHQSDNDMQTLEELVKKQLSAKDLEKFLAFRLIVPISVQVNEEAQYIESQMMSGHMSYLLKKVSQKLNKSLDELDQMTIEEIIAGIKNYYSLKKLPATSYKLVLKGIPASPGRAQGRVRIVPENLVIKDFNRGDILVTRITDPSMVLMMAKAGAIVCDIGGIASHPSIVSREMGIPCVVATKEATKKLKDGDQVLVDGGKGEIYIISPVGENNHFRLKGSCQNQLFKSYPQWIDDLAKSAWYNCGQQTDLETMRPIDLYNFEVLFIDLWVEKIWQMIQRLQKQRVDRDIILKLSPNPSALRAIMAMIIFTFHKSKKINCQLTGKFKQVIEFLYDLLQGKMQRDIFSYQENIIYQDHQVRETLDQVEWHAGNQQHASDLGRVFLGAMCLANSILNDVVTDSGIEIHGPYNLSTHGQPEHLLLIREYRHLNGHDLWPEYHTNLYNQLTIYTIYKKLKIKIGIYSVHTEFKGDPINNLVKWQVMIGEQAIKPEQLPEIRDHFLQQSTMHQKLVKGLDFEGLKQKALEQTCFQFRDMFKLVEMDWQPSHEKRQRVKSSEIQKNFNYQLGDSRQKFEQEFGIEFLKKIFSQ